MKNIDLSKISRKAIEIARIVCLSLMLILFALPICLRLIMGARKYKKLNKHFRLSGWLYFAGSLCGMIQNLLAIYEAYVYGSANTKLVLAILNSLSMGLSTTCLVKSLEELTR